MKTVSIDVEIAQAVLARLFHLSEQRHCSTQALAEVPVIQYLERERLEHLARWRRCEDTGECLSQKGMTDWLESKAREAAERARERY